MTVMVEVTQEDANNYCEVLRALGMEEAGDPVAGIEMLRSTKIEGRAAFCASRSNDELAVEASKCRL